MAGTTSAWPSKIAGGSVAFDATPMSTHSTAADAFLSPKWPELAKPSVILFSPSASAPAGIVRCTVCQPSASGTAADDLPRALARTVCLTGDFRRRVMTPACAWAAVSGTSSTACVWASATRLPSSDCRSFQVGSGREKCT